MAVATIKRFVAGKATYSDQAIETDPTKIIERIKFIERVVHDAVVVLCGSDRVHLPSRNVVGHPEFHLGPSRCISLDLGLPDKRFRKILA